ncbi:OmpA family protein [Hymenobacter sp. BT18]|uniref:OmpA family protein n=1 Tax=Hymenobacter sp. BT18 TaxID=2835648 RepID=UPI00143E9A4A|nr:OmpA family protein [Hymenobacter sp. BT18]QIX62278.1 OmpA family protein [Hymenobacter sp. BT18]
MKYSFLTQMGVLAAGLLGACSGPDKPADQPTTKPAAIVTTTQAKPEAAPAPPPAAPADTAAAGFDISQVPVANPKLGGFPYFSLLDGYQKGDPKGNMISTSAKDYLKDVAFDRYEFFDGTKLIPVDGRLMTTKAVGDGASFYQVQKTYEKLVHDLGGVTVWEGNMEEFQNRKLQMQEKRHRGNYSIWSAEKAGVYVVRTPDREIWVEVYEPYENKNGYWLTVVERKALPMTAKLMPAEEMKKALDANGHVAVYLNFDTNQATLRPDAAQGIGEIVKLLQQDPTLRLTVEGHTDNTGAFTRNQQLSEQRAGTVVAALTAQGIAAERLQPKGLGQTKPLADNSTEEGKAKNRRVELVKR